MPSATNESFTRRAVAAPFGRSPRGASPVRSTSELETLLRKRLRFMAEPESWRRA